VVPSTRMEPGAHEDDGEGHGEQEGSRAGVTAHYQPDAAQISRLSLAASAPAASLKSPPVSRYA